MYMDFLNLYNQYNETIKESFTRKTSKRNVNDIIEKSTKSIISDSVRDLVLKYGSDKNYIDLTVEYGCLPLFKDETNEIKKAKILMFADLKKCVWYKYRPWETNKDYYRIKFASHIDINKDTDEIEVRFFQPVEHQISEDDFIFSFKGAYSLEPIVKFDDLSEKEQRIILSNLIERTKKKRPNRRKLTESFTKKTSGITVKDIQKRAKVIDEIDKLKNFIIENGYKDQEDGEVIYNLDIKDWDVAIGVDFDLLDDLGFNDYDVDDNCYDYGFLVLKKDGIWVYIVKSRDLYDDIVKCIRWDDLDDYPQEQERILKAFFD